MTVINNNPKDMLTELIQLRERNAELLAACKQAMSIMPFVWLPPPTDTDESGEAALHSMCEAITAAITKAEGE